MFYQELNDLIWAAQEGNRSIKNFDCSCFDGKYVAGDIDEDYLDNLEISNRVSEKVSKPPEYTSSWNLPLMEQIHNG